MNADDYKNVVVAWKDGAPIKLRDRGRSIRQHDQ